MQEQSNIPPYDEDDFFDEELARAVSGDEEYVPYDEFPRVPIELKQLDQWVNWQQDEGRKIPLNPRTLRNAGVAYENTWSTFHFAAAVAARENLGIGFVLTEQDLYTCIDLDKVIGGRELKPYAREILDAMTGYVELSPSGTGLHVWVKSREAFNRRTQGIEVYSDHRWMTVTGRANPRVPTEVPDRTEQVKALVEQRFPKPEPAVFTRPKQVEQDDAALWQKLFSTRNGNFLQALYDGDLSVVKDDHSRGVIMLANMLAVYTHSDAARMESLLAQTKLVNDKWHEKRGKLTWIEFQVRDAIDFVHRREMTRQRREQEEQEEGVAKKESQSVRRKQATKGSGENKKDSKRQSKGANQRATNSQSAELHGDKSSRQSDRDKATGGAKQRRQENRNPSNPRRPSSR